MKTSVNPATVGAMARDARTAAGLSQSELGQKIGASRFWVAQFEKGKPSAELGLALKALAALDLIVSVTPRQAANIGVRKPVPRTDYGPLPAIDLAQIIAANTISGSPLRKERLSSRKAPRARRHR